MTILRNHSLPDGTIIEIGANIGVVSYVVLTDKTSGTGILICIELSSLSGSQYRRITQQRAHHNSPFTIGVPDVEGAEIPILKQKPKFLDRCSQIFILRIRRHKRA